MSDFIVVLDGAHVVELASHDKLVTKAGQYAELYGIRLQLIADRPSTASAALVQLRSRTAATMPSSCPPPSSLWAKRT